MNQHTDDETQEYSPVRISEKTSVQLTVIGFIITILVGGIWWCSAMDTKMNTLLEDMRSMRTLSEKIVDHEARIKNLEARK